MKTFTAKKRVLRLSWEGVGGEESEEEKVSHQILTKQLKVILGFESGKDGKNKTLINR